MPETKTISIREVAARAGVSTGTVSHVLNNNTTARIAPATQERVRAAAASLGYRPNRYARSLGRRKTDTIGLLISGLRNPFFVELLESVEEAVVSAGFTVHLNTAPSIQGTYMLHPPIYSSWPVDGAIVWLWNKQTAEEFLGAQASSLPIVYLGAERTDNCDWVSFDYKQGGQMAGKHLIEQGYRRIAYIGPYIFDDFHYEGRYAGLSEICSEAGVFLSQQATDGEENRRAGFRVAETFIALPKSQRPEALFCHNDVLAIGVYNGLIRAGLRIPDDVALMGFDGIEEAQEMPQKLTTVRIDTQKLAKEAMSFLCQRMHNVGQQQAQQRLIAPMLLSGETT